MGRCRDVLMLGTVFAVSASCGFSTNRSQDIDRQSIDVGQIAGVDVRFESVGDHRIHTAGIDRGGWDWFDSEAFAVTWYVELDSPGARETVRWQIGTDTVPTEEEMRALLESAEVLERCESDRRLAIRLRAGDKSIPSRFGDNFIRITIPSDSTSQMKARPVAAKDCASALTDQPMQDRPEARPASGAALQAPPAESAKPPPDRFTAFFAAFCEADDTTKVSMLAPDFIGHALFVAGGQDPKTANAVAGLMVTDVGTRMIVPTFPMCEAGAEPSYDVAPGGQGTATIAGRSYRVGLSVEPLLLTHLLLELPSDPTAGGPPTPNTGDVFISTMEVPATPVPASLQRRLESFLVKQRGCVDAYAATTDEPVGASVDLVVPREGAPYLSARTVAELGVLACFEARLATKTWHVDAEARLILHYGVPVSAPADGDTVYMRAPD